jgi:hypothetical protein
LAPLEDNWACLRFELQYTGLFKKKYTLSKIYFTCTIEHMVTCCKKIEGRTLKSYFHTLQALDVSPTCDTADAKWRIQLFPHSSQHVTGNSSHSLSDAPLQIIDIRSLRDFLSIRT